MREKKGKKLILTILFAVAMLGIIFHTTVRQADTKSMLSKEIYACRELVNTAEAGTQKGTYPENAIELFAEQVEAGASVLSDMEAGDTEVQQALKKLKAAKERFQASVNTENESNDAADAQNLKDSGQVENITKQKETDIEETAAETQKEEKELHSNVSLAEEPEQQETEKSVGIVVGSNSSDAAAIIPDSKLNVNTGSGMSYKESNVKGDKNKSEKTDISKEDAAKSENDISLDLSDQKNETKQDTTEKTNSSETTATEKETTASENNTSNAGGSGGENTSATEKPAQSETTPSSEEKKRTCTIGIRCETILNNMSDLKAGLAGYVPANGVILPDSKIQLYDGETVFDVLKRVTRATGLKLEFRNDGVLVVVYIVGINHLNEFDCGNGSGWMYTVNGWFPNYGCSKYVLKDGDMVQWIYTCDLGRDIGGDFWE